MRNGTKEVKEIEEGEIVPAVALEVSPTVVWRSTGARVLSWGGLNGHRADTSPCKLGFVLLPSFPAGPRKSGGRGRSCEMRCGQLWSSLQQT